MGETERGVLGWALILIFEERETRENQFSRSFFFFFKKRVVTFLKAVTPRIVSVTEIY